MPSVLELNNPSTHERKAVLCARVSSKEQESEFWRNGHPPEGEPIYPNPAGRENGSALSQSERLGDARRVGRGNSLREGICSIICQQSGGEIRSEI